MLLTQERESTPPTLDPRWGILKARQTGEIRGWFSKRLGSPNKTRLRCTQRNWSTRETTTGRELQKGCRFEPWSLLIRNSFSETVPN